MELYRSHRPNKLSEVKGQEHAVQVLKGYAESKSLPHALLFTGPSGCGKTTLTRILSKLLKVNEHDYREIDAGSKGGVDVVRDIKDKIGLVAFGGRKKVYVIDEAHELTRAAQEALLKTAEECPKHAYIFLCTTDPKDLLPTIKTRFTEIQVSALEPDAISDLLAEVAKKEGKKVESEVIDRIIEVSDGSARFALNVLGKVINVKDVSKQLDIIQKTEAKRTSWDLVQLLLGWGQKGKKTSWAEVKNLLNQLKGQEDPEKIRRTILSCLAAECLRGGKPAQRAAVMYEAFRDDYYSVGFSGLVFSCYAACPGA